MPSTRRSERGPRAVAPLAALLLAAGCYAAHPQVPAWDADAGPTEAGPAVDGASSYPCGLTEAGLPACDYEVPGCGRPVCDGGSGCRLPDYCICHVPDWEPGDPLRGFCIDDPVDPNYPGGCSTEQPCPAPYACADIGVNVPERGFRAGLCARPAVCAELAREEDVGCFFADGTPWEPGPLAEGSCAPAERGLLCGPGCGGCPEGYACFGPSVRHPLGLCAQAPLRDSLSLCREYRDRPSCPVGEACLRIRPPEDARFAEGTRPPGVCLAPERCRAVAARHPERFQCEE